MSTPLDTMVGGNHYRGGKMQPVQFFHANQQLDWQQQNIIKYAYRHKDKHGHIDLLKVVHYALIECQLEYPEKLDDFKELVSALL